MHKTTAIPKWKPGSIKAGQRYKHTINGKTYTLEAKYSATVPTFNPIWFENVYPKKHYFVNKTAFDSSDAVLLPNDTIYVDTISYKNINNGILTNAALSVLFDEYIEHKQNSNLLINGYEDHRKHLIKVRPYVNLLEPELKYFAIDDQTGYAYVRLCRVLQEVVIDFQVVEVLTPVRASSKNYNSVIINHDGYDVTTVGEAPISSTATTKTYSIPNSLTTKRLIVTLNGDDLILNYQ